MRQSAAPRSDSGGWKQAAWTAASDPYSWVPALGAVAVGVTRADRRISDWAQENHPLYGSDYGAHQASHALVDLSCAGALASAFAPRRARDEGGMGSPRAVELAVEGGAVGAALGITEGLKRIVQRERPDGSDAASFPSGHAAAAFSCAALTRRNLDDSRMRENTRMALGVSSTAVAAAAGWARVEEGKHYPSDVLAAAALGNFLSSFSYELFIAKGEHDSLSFSVVPGTHAPMFVVNVTL